MAKSVSIVKSYRDYCHSRQIFARHEECRRIDLSLSTKDSLLLMFLAGPPRADEIASMTNRIKKFENTRTHGRKPTIFYLVKRYPRMVLDEIIIDPSRKKRHSHILVHGHTAYDSRTRLHY